MVITLTACSSPPAPVYDRSDSTVTPADEIDGQYRIRKGDTLHAIAFRYGLDHRELARWNHISPPYVIYPDQLLTLESPPPLLSRQNSVARSSERPAAPTGSTRSSTETETPADQPSVVPRAPAASTPRPAIVEQGDPRSWAWPVDGRVTRGFLVNNPTRNGLDIAGKDGQEIKAAAGGTVVYSGNGLIGFGELIIIKHSERMLSAYAHNRLRLVVEGDLVQQGQKIAELGRNDRNEPILHFEIRVNGRPVDPRKYLPAR